MGFSAKQNQALRRNLNATSVRTRELNGRELSYIEGWHAIAEANRIFGFEGWDRETVESRCVMARERTGTFHAVYVAKVRITVRTTGATVVREGNGTGEARANSPGEVHDTALKAAETDATKRALATFGKPFGLALYLSPKSAHPKYSHHRAAVQADGTGPSAKQNNSAIVTESQLGEISKAPIPRVNNGGHIDKSELTLGEPRRLRDKAHLRFVASEPCLICGRQPVDAHHLRFTQPRALGRKVSDEFTVPLCRIHHREAHKTGNEAAWWEDMNIDAVAIALGLWGDSHDRHLSAVGVSSNGNGA